MLTEADFRYTGGYDADGTQHRSTINTAEIHNFWRQHIALIAQYIQTRIKQGSAKQESVLWQNQARPEQLEPQQPWNTWLILAGRGFGKTRTGAETVWGWVNTNRYRRIGLIGQTMIEARQVMIEGESGLLNVIDKKSLKRYRKQEGILEFKNGATIQLFAGDRPERLRGPQFDAVWVDELAKFKKTDLLWQQLSLCLRLGSNPKCIVTTTPRKNPLINRLIEDPGCVVTRGSTFDNAANLARGFIQNLRKQFSGTRLEAQEIFAQVLDEAEGALWNRDIITYETPPNDDWRRVIISVDPADTNTDSSDETGIIVIGLHSNQKAYVLEDASMKAKPSVWVKKVIDLYHHYKADRVVAEVNKGGDMVRDLLISCDERVNYKGVRATKGKAIRAEPIVGLYEQGKIRHKVPFPLLEKQLCEFVPESSASSPDRLDALVWGLTDLFLTHQASHQYKVWV